MLLILTHENSDFDAIASQLAANKLYPEGIPLLSWRINRNVEQFLNLYWDAFHFMRPKDWQRKKVQQVILVDTISLPSVRGIRHDRVEVRVIDHHEFTGEQKPSWTYHTELVGATTTLLVEMLQKIGLTLSSIEATLLLLGIHEDTGSLSYDTTTHRDARAVAWLMEQGAKLQVVRRFLNIALSEQQQDLFHQLQESAKWVFIEGKSILLASAVAPEDFDDEISAIAHRLRDVMTPDAMFLVVQLKYDHVQLVARASTDQIDVGEIARSFGGGGHSRAAAATIMDSDFREVLQEIQQRLPLVIKPMVRVSQIMSYGVQTIDSTSTINKAAEQMQRFGHEGYPIVDRDDGSLVGLLTRRMVDRAMNHQLGGMPVGQVMKVGQVTVRPSESVEHVQKLMIQEGWGQIPVVSDDADRPSIDTLIGIVTRTDLINLQSNADAREDAPNLRHLMEESLPESLWGMVKTVSQMASHMDMPLYFVGGLVRDLLLGQSPADIDMVVEGDAIELVQKLQREYGGETRSHAQFGTAKWLLNNVVWEGVAPGISLDGAPMVIDFVTARKEFYTSPSALPLVERGSIKLDLHRRDFTINTLAIRLDGAHLGELLDFYGGRRDLERGLIRVLHSLSFVDDPTRILRAVRLEQRLGFKIEARTEELIKAALPMLNRATGDRIRNELDMCLGEPKRIPIMARLDEFGVLTQIHPAFAWKEENTVTFTAAECLLETEKWNEIVSTNEVTFVYFALMLLPFAPKIQHEVMNNLKVRKSTVDDVVAIRQLLRALDDLPKDPQPSVIEQGLRPFHGRVLLVALAAVNPDSLKGKMIQKYQDEWKNIKPILTGKDLLDMGFKPGPNFGYLLDSLLAARLDGLVSDEQSERSFLAVLVKELDDTERSHA